MLFADRFHDPIRRGEVTLTFRRWKRPQARPGGVYRIASGGFVEASAVEVIEPSSVTSDAARAAGFADAETLLRDLAQYEGDLYRIALRYRADVQDERALLAAQETLGEDDRAGVLDRLARMDGGGRGAWTMDLLRLIATNEGTRAADLAAIVGRETVRFKSDVRRLKALGLTESLEVGYRISPRGRALLADLDRQSSHEIESVLDSAVSSREIERHPDQETPPPQLRELPGGHVVLAIEEDNGTETVTTLF